MPEFEFTLRLERDVGREWIEDNVMGSGALTYEWWRGAAVSDEGVMLVVADPEDNGGDGAGTIAKMMRWGDFVKAANALSASDYRGKWLVVGQLAEDDLDADGADQILQWHMFGKVVYG